MSVDTCNLSELAKLGSGGTPSKSNTAFWEGSIPWLTPKDMANFDGTTQDHVSALAIGKGTKLAPANAIFIAVRGMSLHNEIRIVRPKREMAFNQDIKSIVPTDAIDDTFLFYALKDRVPDLLSQVHAAGHGTGVLATELINSTPIPLFSMPEQMAIGAALSELDDKIELNRRMNETLEEMARALFRDWFVEFGPTRRQIAMKEKGLATDPDAIMGHAFPPEKATTLAPLFPAKLGDDGLPEGWSYSDVGTEFDVEMGQSPPGDTYNETGDGLPFFQGRRDFGFRFPSRRVYCTAPKRISGRDWTLLSVRAPVGDINRAVEQCAIGRGVGAFLHKAGLHSFTYYTGLALRTELQSYDKDGTVFGSINQKQFKGLQVVVPEGNLCAHFEEVAKPIDDKIRLNTEENQTLAEMRDLLLPKLMSGEIRLKDVEKKL